MRVLRTRKEIDTVMLSIRYDDDFIVTWSDGSSEFNVREEFLDDLQEMVDGGDSGSSSYSSSSYSRPVRPRRSAPRTSQRNDRSSRKIDVKKVAGEALINGVVGAAVSGAGCVVM
jgi:hypothetical protein